ncbi:phosphoenolpyruvate--protein phosphotransferase [Solirubrobacter sp. CPCC 204708]|uniref:Phosphoenolpyruvate-protein phosphotransferase n=1 Tax=Solirubrobacter deserti TaxID=2282478 RepID=A0ABT4RFJ3_9ACTN|nr:putative PEP-binding protein [Solirubrobacter deserti]MBE2319408.1 phosphoenolpyruvate--protein phosphotransferase [Solirubrobacter deserti]MDA0137307.1 PEP-utilizing enzyme [Solirubrobacter deserti]
MTDRAAGGGDRAGREPAGAERRLRGLAASPGVAAGAAWRVGTVEHAAHSGDAAAELARARAALKRAGDELTALADRLRADGAAEQADIVETGVLMAADPALDAAVEASIARGSPAPQAIIEATDQLADTLAAIDDPMLALRADDVRSLGRRAASERVAPSGPGPFVLVAQDLGPADVAELDERVAGIALAAGGPSAHAAVIARGLGLPMVVGVGAPLLELADGTPLAVDGDRGDAVVDPRDPPPARRRAAAVASGPAVTRDGLRVRILANAAGPAEVRVALAAGAEGVGLLRTELAFLDAAAWPDEAAHRRMLEPVLALLAGRTATVRVLDFGGDKTPPFLRDTTARGIALLLDHPGALAAQLQAIGTADGVRVLLPLVRDAADVEAVRAHTQAPLGAMIETAAAAARADEIAAVSDFLSIGTNDLTADVLGTDRFAPGTVATHDPRVLARIAAVAHAAQAHGRVLEVCGEAASDPRMIPLLVGLGVGELSVGAARVAATHAAVRALEGAAQLARTALAAKDAGGGAATR